MPLYDYQCSKCQHVTEVRHGFDDAYDAPCAACGGAMKRVFNPAPIIFNGSGFYVTDSRGTAGSSAPAASGGSEPAAKTGGSESAA